MRSGSSGNVVNQTVLQKMVRYDGVVSTNQTTSRIYSDDRQSWSGGDTRSYNRKKRMGELLPLNHYSKFKVHNFVNNSVFNTRNRVLVGGVWKWNTFYYTPGSPGWGTSTLSESYLSSLPSSLGLDPRDYVQAAAAKIASSGWDALTFAAELRSTVAMFRGIVQSLLNLIRHGNLTNSWLQYRYGWRTLYMDMVQLSKVISDLDSDRKRYIERVGGNFTTSLSSINTWDYVSSTGSYTVDTEIEIGLRGIVAADIEPPSFQFNPVVTAWELTKFSFIIDWIIQVGQWINAMSFLALQTKYYAASSLSIDVTRSSTVIGFTPKTDWGVDAATTDFSTRAQLLVRSPTAVPIRFTTGLNLNELKVIDLIALIRQALSR